MTDPHPLLRFVSLLSIAHHIPGRIRLKLAAKDTDLADAIAQAKRFGRLVTEAPGIRSVNVNLLARSCVVEYDADRIPPAAWGDLLAGTPSDAAERLLRALTPPAGAA
ncbi:HMA2 domain-containing protein [Azospirillum doebereinerae]|uniref:Cation transporter n=1 Tax=Azospirillum doebereinerae TaxID=92933 RepID=A0A3S0XBV5_9PROT|nr:cation transporter [Azospirillum doebereinerae]RUQ72153.1 cation transporter [Azospirillum doebereinerae]